MRFVPLLMLFACTPSPVTTDATTDLEDTGTDGIITSSTSTTTTTTASSPPESPGNL